MNRYYYDLHVHSCLSPCGDNDMTPENIAGMSAIAGLNIVALTDHNSAKNCRAFYCAAKKQGIIPVAGMELTTAEDIHVICLFEELTDAEAFDIYLQPHRNLIPNRTDIFGDQLIYGCDDKIKGVEEYFLTNATDISVDDVPEHVNKFKGICYPAHIDRESNGIIAVLGTFPDNPGFKCAEFHDSQKIDNYKEKYPSVRERQIIVSSDAHYLWDIRDKENYFYLDDEPYSGEKVRHELFNILRSGEN